MTDDTGEIAAAYLFDALLTGEIPNIVDVGANPVNEPPYAKMLAAGRCNVYGFEPHQGAYEELLKNKGPNEYYFNTAVGDGKRHDLQIVKPSGFTSLLPLAAEGFDYLGHWTGAADSVTVETVETVKLDDVVDLPEIDLVKIDIQGGEKIVFQNGRNKMSQAVTVISEVRHSQLYHGEPMFGGLDTELRDQGLIFHKFYDNKPVVLNNSQFKRLNVGGNRNQLVDGDAVYICNLISPDDISSRQLRMLAMVSHEVFRSYDLTTRCLDLLVAREEVSPDAPEAYVDRLPAHFRRDK